MCTSLTFQSKDRQFLLGRTMDFAFELEASPVIIPRGYEWESDLGEQMISHFGFVGAGRNLGNYLVADGVNEKGLAVAELYFLNEAKYSNHQEKALLNLAPHEFIMWLLGEIESVSDLRGKINDIHIVNQSIELLDIVLPLHFIVMDRFGETVVIETNRGYIEIKDNPVGVMTNSPEFEWHLKNLNNYLSLRTTNFEEQPIGKHVIRPFGQGSGSYGLPGGDTSTERFVRTVFNRRFTEVGATLGASVNNMFHILNSVTIPRGVNIKNDGSVDYTQYRSVMDTDNLTYFFNSYDRQDVFSVTLTENYLTAKTPTEFKVPKGFTAQALNR